MKNTQSTDRIRAIFDNGGGITLQLPGYAHYYPSSADPAALDFAAYEATHDTSGWDGHDPEAADLEPSPEQIRNGSYRVMGLSEIIMAVHGEDEAGRSGYWGAAQREFINTLRESAGNDPLPE